MLPVWCSLDSIKASGAFDLGSNPSTGVFRDLEKGVANIVPWAIESLFQPLTSILLIVRISQ